MEQHIKEQPSDPETDEYDVPAFDKAEEYKKMTASFQNPVFFFRSSPLHSVEVDLTHYKNLHRDVEL